jgi:hypothetical protein
LSSATAPLITATRGERGLCEVAALQYFVQNAEPLVEHLIDVPANEKCASRSNARDGQSALVL